MKGSDYGTLTVIIGISKNKKGVNLLFVEHIKSTHFLFADFSILIFVNDGEGFLDPVHVGEPRPKPASSGGGIRVHDANELLKVQGAVVVDVAQGEDGVHLVLGEPDGAVHHLLLGDRAVVVDVDLLEQLFDLERSISVRIWICFLDIVHLQGFFTHYVNHYWQ